MVMDNDLDSLLYEAIKNRKKMLLKYKDSDDEFRLVEPQCYGIGENGHKLLRAYQISPGPAMNKLFKIPSGFSGTASILNDRFNSPGPNYRKGDSAMKKIICQL
jgi:hypothetical protein